MNFKLFKKNKPRSEITILYGSHSGNSKYIARETSKILMKQGVENECYNLNNFSVKEISQLKYLFLVISTYGEGDPPPSAKEFYEYLHKTSIPSLKQLKYSVCALGDSSYNNFCKTGIDFDKRLSDLGGRAIINRVDCDMEYGKNASVWIKEVVSYLKSTPISTQSIFLPSKKEKKYLARIKSKERINHPLSEKELFHLELSVWDKSISYSPGDTISILPRNPEHLVREVLKTVMYKNVKTTIKLDQYQSIFNQLLCKYEITRLLPQTVENYNQLVKSDELKQLQQNRSELEKFLKGSNILTLLAWYPFNITIDQLTQILPELKPRKYSIASSLKKHPQEVHLTVRTVSYSNHRGACTHYLNHYLKTNDQLEIEVLRNRHFHFDAKNIKPIIMVATGAGIAPFRAFLEELDAINRKRSTWLIFGERNPKYDKIYHNELTKYIKKGVLEKLDTAYSRGNPKNYVQDIIRDSKTEVLDWINNGAEIFICGSSAMGRGVKKVFEEILLHGDQQLELLLKENRYREEYF